MGACAVRRGSFGNTRASPGASPAPLRLALVLPVVLRVATNILPLLIAHEHRRLFPVDRLRPDVLHPLELVRHLRRPPALPRADDKSVLEQIRLDDVLERVAL